MACFATPYGLRYAGHCFNRAYAQNNRQTLIPAGGKLGVTSTGIANRRRLAQALEQEIDRSERTGQPFAIAIFDLDHFKQINDRFGHNAGDRVLKRVAADAVMELRHDDILGRFGGEEFVILFPRVGADVALKVAERVRHRIECSASEPAVTISIGVAEQVLGESAESILRRADEALYLAKDSGRNTLRLAS